MQPVLQVTTIAGARKSCRRSWFAPTAVVLVAFPIALGLVSCGAGDGSGGSSGPVAHDACDYTGLNQRLSAQLRGTDPQSRALTYSIVDNPSQGSVTLTDPLQGEFTYTPNTDARGIDGFRFRVNNGETDSAPATYRIVYTPRIMPLGDSITEGVTVGGSPNIPPSDQRISYRKTLYGNLTAAGFSVDFVGSLSNGSAAGIPDPDHEGHPGWCDDDPCSSGTIDAGITSFLNDSRPDVVLLHIGTNDFSTDASGVNSILDKISAWAASNFPVAVFLARIIPARDGLLDVTTFNNAVEGIATPRPGLRIFSVDQQSELRSADNANIANAALMADNLHPNQTGYDRMAARWQNSVIGSGVIPRCP